VYLLMLQQVVMPVKEFVAGRIRTFEGCKVIKNVSPCESKHKMSILTLLVGVY
jgi:hypothetical protein